MGIFIYYIPSDTYIFSHAIRLILQYPHQPQGLIFIYRADAGSYQLFAELLRFFGLRFEKQLHTKLVFFRNIRHVIFLI